MKAGRRRCLRLLPAVVAGLGAPAFAAPAWPARPVRLIVVYPPGGLSDGVARALVGPLAQRLGVPVWADNRAGAGGRVGLRELARSPADGHTLAFSAISPLTLPSPVEVSGFDPLRDIAPVAGVLFTPVLLVGTPAWSGGGFDALLAQARERPGALRWATSGVGTAGHLVLEQVQRGAGVRFTHVPYKGGGQQLSDALAGHFELLSTNAAPAAWEHIAAGRLRPLAVGAPQRLAAAPQVPRFEELGLPQANLGSLFGVFAPAGTPSARLDRLQAEIQGITRAPTFRERVLGADDLPVALDRAGFAQRIADERRLHRTPQRVGGRNG